MQFLSTSWARWGLLAPDRPPGATPDVHNAWDAIYTAAAFLCGRRAEIGDVRAAVLRYNRSEAYYREVMAKAAEYGGASSSRGSGAGGAGGATVAGSTGAVIAAALTQLGVPYRWGMGTPGVGFDCSGLVQWAFAQAGLKLPRTTSQQVLSGVPVARVEDLRPGDLVFSRSVRSGQVVDGGHVAIYVGGGQVIVAPRTDDVVEVRPLGGGVQAVRRIIG